MPEVLNCSRCNVLFDSDTLKSIRINKFGYELCDDCYCEFKKWLKGKTKVESKEIPKPKKVNGDNKFNLVLEGYGKEMKPHRDPTGLFSKKVDGNPLDLFGNKKDNEGVGGFGSNLEFNNRLELGSLDMNLGFDKLLKKEDKEEKKEEPKKEDKEEKKEEPKKEDKEEKKEEPKKEDKEEKGK